jgi:hypothetical protein
MIKQGIDMKLTRRGNEYIILANGKSLTSSRMHGSEEALATLACRRLQTLKQPCVLVGSLGMGFTLRATLNFLPPDAIVVVAESVPAVVDFWSAREDRKFEQRLRYGGFRVEVEARLRSPEEGRRPPHYLFGAQNFVGLTAFLRGALSI